MLVNPSVFRKIGAKKFARAESPDFESDDDDDPAVNDEDSVAAGDSRPTKRQRSAEGLDVDDDDDESPFSDPHKLDEEIREEKITIFLSDPEKVVRTFLSSYMREHGLIWYVKFLVIACHDCLIFTIFHHVQDGTKLDLRPSPHLFFPCFRCAEPCHSGTCIPAWLEASPRND